MIDKIKKINLKKLFKLFCHNAINFVRYNRQFISCVILCLISCMLVRHFTINSLWNFEATFFDLSVILLICSFAYFFKPRKQFAFFMVVTCVITLMNFINAIYYAFFTDFVSFSLLESMGQTAEVSDAVLEKLSIYNFIYLLAPLFLIIINRYLYKKDYFNVVEKLEVGKRLFIGVAIVGGICLFLNISTLDGTDISRFSKQWNREYVVERFGIIIYQGNDLIQSLQSKLNSLFGYEEAEKRFLQYFAEHPNTPSDNKYTNKFKGYNLIVMHMESVMGFLVNLEINGEEVTPNLNKLIAESMYFDNFYPQVSVGTSSDTEFTFNTSLMPVQRGTVFVSYNNRTYVTLEKLLAEKNYYTFSMHGNKASMWSRNKMHKTLGYMDFYSQEYYTIDEEVGLGLSDHSFFIQSEDIIKQISDEIKNSKDYSNFMGTMITLSNHTPFEDDSYLTGEDSFDVRYHTGKYNEKGEEIIYDYLYDSKIFKSNILGNYIKSVHYADECLGEFIDYVKTHDEYDKTLFVFYGDHAAQIGRSYFNKFINYDFNTGELKDESDPTYVDYDYYAHELFKKTPLIFWTKNKEITGTVSYPMGMIDVLPTIGNMLGIYNEYALGHDIFEIKNNNTVVFPNGNFLTDKVYYYNFKNEVRNFKADVLDADYIENHRKYAEDILSISDDIIVYDLIERTKNKEVIGDTDG